MSDQDKTGAGQVDDDAIERAKKNTKKKQSQLDQIFNDNKSGRYNGPTDS
jgi:hypothetical protein